MRRGEGRGGREDKAGTTASEEEEVEKEKKNDARAKGLRLKKLWRRSAAFIPLFSLARRGRRKRSRSHATREKKGKNTGESAR